jgi:hypothetical protein
LPEIGEEEDEGLQEVIDDTGGSVNPGGGLLTGAATSLGLIAWALRKRFFRR